ALARARFADDRNRLAALDLQIDPAHGLDAPIWCVEIDSQAANVEQRPVCLHPQRSFGSKASRNPSPMKLRQNSVPTKKPAGKINCHGADCITFVPSAISTPQEVSGSETPRPR